MATPQIPKPSHEQVVTVHAFVVGPLLAYIGFRKGDVDPRIFTLLLALGLIATAYHGNTWYNKYSSKYLKK